MPQIELAKQILKGNFKTDARAIRLAGLVLLGAAQLAAQSRPATDARIDEHSAVPARQIVISIPDRKLALVENGRVVKVYSVAVGRRVTPSPTGTLFIANRVKNPTYYRPGVVIPPGKNDPVGTRWMGLSKRGYGIHGTDEPRSIGHAASHGCIRMRNRDAEDLFNRVRVGDVVEFHAQRDAVILALFHGVLPEQPVLTAANYVTARAH
ncbi:MAG: L,D-transpeptidase [Acidobacteriota bacterium]|nr:L,D-transpeptidase [Acidobacteriota bacterium]